MYKAVPHEQVWAKGLVCMFNDLLPKCFLDCIEDFVSQWCYCPARGVQERRRFSCSEIGAFFFFFFAEFY